jgi:hypothetical protein
MNEQVLARDVEAHQIVEEDALIDHLVRTFHSDPFVHPAPRRWRAQGRFERYWNEGDPAR